MRTVNLKDIDKRLRTIERVALPDQSDVIIFIDDITYPELDNPDCVTISPPAMKRYVNIERLLEEERKKLDPAKAKELRSL